MAAKKSIFSVMLEVMARNMFSCFTDSEIDGTPEQREETEATRLPTQENSPNSSYCCEDLQRTEMNWAVDERVYEYLEARSEIHYDPIVKVIPHSAFEETEEDAYLSREARYPGGIGVYEYLKATPKVQFDLVVQVILHSAFEEDEVDAYHPRGTRSYGGTHAIAASHASRRRGLSDAERAALYVT